MPSILFIIPAFNEEGSIARVVSELRESFPAADVAVINDGSSDRTSELARRAGATVVDLPINLGIGTAVQTGFILAARRGHDVTVQFDGDGQHLASEVGNLLAPILKGEADVVIGSRFLKRNGYRGPILRRIGISIFSAINQFLVRQKITDSTSGFRAYNRSSLLYLSTDYPHDYPEPESILNLARRGFRIVEVPVAMKLRETGTSSITLLRSIYYVSKVLLAIMIGMTRRRERSRVQ